MVNPRKTKLDKGEFLRFLDKKEIFNGFELVNNRGSQKIQMNPGLPAMLLRSISQFVRKSMDDLVITDAFEMYWAIQKFSGENEVDYREVKEFKYEHNLSFFGGHQYDLLEYYRESLMN